MRAFLAVEIPAEVRRRLKRLQETLAAQLAGVRWVRVESVHLTLLFLGEIDEGIERDLSDAAREVCSGVHHGTAVAKGVGWFPPRGSPRVIWAGLRQDEAGTLTSLHRALAPAAAACGIAVEDRPFAPHLTLGRARGRLSRAAVDRALAPHTDIDLGPIPVESCTLFQSILGTGGARYVPRVVLGLAG